MEEIHFDFWLGNLPGIGIKAINRLLNYAGSPSEIWQLTREQLEKDELKLSKKQIESIITGKNVDYILSSYEQMCLANIHFFPQTHHEYPSRLRDIHDAPFALYVHGKLPDPECLSVAIVGARSCSEYGRYVTRKIGEALGRRGIQTISGLARGIDVIAQKATLDVGGHSFAVLGCGPDICYPEENKDVYNVMSTSGGIISEYCPGTLPKSAFFPLRNRIISGLADVVVVIEAKEKSGSLITADQALEQGRDVYALPGRVTDTCSHGTNRLIRQGAGIILSPEEFIEDLEVNYSLSHLPIIGAGPDEFTNNEFSIYSDFSENDKKILSALSDFNPSSLTEIQTRTRLPIGELNHLLLQLIMKGIVSTIGGMYILKR